jgi:hypothetical protein
MPCFAEEGCELLEGACRLDLEGIVAKRKADVYGPNTAWYLAAGDGENQSECGLGNEGFS